MSGNRNYNNRYMYETSPRKLKPDYIPYEKQKPVQKKKPSTLKQTEKGKQQKTKIQKNAKKGKMKCIFYLILGFTILFAISYRNSQINESFSQLKEAEEQLSVIQKENEQLEVSIEKSLNLNELEKIAREQLGMQKATSSQTKYISLPKEDHIEGMAEEVKLDISENFLQKIIEYVKNIF